MATPTSSSNRSKRKGTKPITQGQNPQRSNRQKVSNAQVTNSNTRGSNAGSAKVTSSSSPAPKPAPVQRRTRVNGKVKPGMVQRNQVGQPKVQRQGPTTSNVPPRATPQPPAKPSGNFKAPNIPKPGKPAAKPPVSGVRRVGGGLVSGTILTAAAGKAIETLGRAAQPSEWNRVQRELQARGYGGRKLVNKDPNGRSSTGVRVSDKANQRDYKAAPTGSQQYNDYRNRQIADNRARLQGVGNPPKPKPPTPRQQPPAASSPAARPSASRPTQTRPSRTTATATGSQQARPAEKKPSMGRETFDRSGKGKLGPNYGIDQFGDKNGIDMERRRAFLDAKDSQEGRKAINKLMEERRKKQRENDSTSK